MWDLRERGDEVAPARGCTRSSGCIIISRCSNVNGSDISGSQRKRHRHHTPSSYSRSDGLLCLWSGQLQGSLHIQIGLHLFLPPLWLQFSWIIVLFCFSFLSPLRFLVTCFIHYFIILLRSHDKYRGSPAFYAYFK